MKYFELTTEEQELLDAYEKGEFQSVAHLEEEKKRFRSIASNSLNKTKNINIRLSERTVAKLKRKAAEEGIPYQTLATSILHKFSNT